MSVVLEAIGDKMALKWRHFIKSGNCSEIGVRPQILESWERCFKTGLNPYSNSKHANLDEEQFQVALIQNKDLLQIARPLMDNLYKTVAGSGFAVVLTDSSGYMIELFAAKDTLLNPLAVNFFAGACWSEAEEGTNAIGTALAIRQPIQISGAEHYCYKNHRLTCSAAPIFDTKGSLIGVLDISGESSSAHSHTLGMAVAAAEAIMAQMAILEKNREIRDINRQLALAKIPKPAGKLGRKQDGWQFRDIIGDSSGMLEAVKVAKLAATTTANVLLHGESGTGKEVFAQAIHNKSDRQAGPFVAVNCGAIPKELIASELFGYEEGSFTGARRGGKQGKFELASGGTLFLDEIGDMPLEQQVALLRVLQERKIFRVGGDKEIPVDVRIICATNKSLLAEIAKGNFRQDLYYRLNVISITIPPLSDRGKDILLLFNYFLEKFNKSSGHNFVLDLEAGERIMNYNWPGNVRELQNTVERIVSLAQSPLITSEHLPGEIRSFRKPENSEKNSEAQPDDSAGIPENIGREQFRKLRQETEKREILTWLKSYSGNVSLTAKKIGVSRNTLYRKMKIYGIEN